MESRLQENLKQKHENYIFPFFWQYEDGCQFMEEELEKIYESGAGAVCVESRHHPDYCGKTWWRDMDTIMGFARTHDMKVWVLDDDRFSYRALQRGLSAGGQSSGSEISYSP